MPLDKEEEVFEIVNNENIVVGRRYRGECHKGGIPHRAVYCLVFDKANRLLLQQRSDRKKIGPRQWDLSLAEHLQPGESYLQAVIRGLEEELGIRVDSDRIEGPLAPSHRRELAIPGVVHDVEYVECYKLAEWEGDLKIDRDEVQEIRWVSLDEAYQEIEGSESHTSWLKAELQSLRSKLCKGAPVLC